jgi:hypothetical protein
LGASFNSLFVNRRATRGAAASEFAGDSSAGRFAWLGDSSLASVGLRFGAASEMLVGASDRVGETTVSSRPEFCALRSALSRACKAADASVVSGVDDSTRPATDGGDVRKGGLPGPRRDVAADPLVLEFTPVVPRAEATNGFRWYDALPLDGRPNGLPQVEPAGRWPPAGAFSADEI